MQLLQDSRSGDNHTRVGLALRQLGPLISSMLTGSLTDAEKKPSAFCVKLKVRMLFRTLSDHSIGAPALCSMVSVVFGRCVAGNCSTVARWPGRSCVSSTILPLANSRAS